MSEAATAVALQTIGARVRRAMMNGGSGRVLAVFRRSFYFESGDALICVGGPRLGAGPLNALAAESLEIEGLAVGTSGEWRGLVLHLANGLGLDAATATPWTPMRRIAPLTALADALYVVPPRGMGRIIPELLGKPDFHSGDPIDAKLARGLRALQAWLREGTQPIPDAIADVIGLGTGLTPAGDDMLGGALIVLRQTQPTVANNLAAQILPLARERTSRIAFAHLEAAADGEGASALHDALAALDTRESLIEALRQLDTIGHSSGWDGLAGATAALTG